MKKERAQSAASRYLINGAIKTVTLGELLKFHATFFPEATENSFSG
jgi:hypothetical protein